MIERNELTGAPIRDEINALNQTWLSSRVRIHCNKKVAIGLSRKTMSHSIASSLLNFSASAAAHNQLAEPCFWTHELEGETLSALEHLFWGWRHCGVVVVGVPLNDIMEVASTPKALTYCNNNNMDINNNRSITSTLNRSITKYSDRSLFCFEICDLRSIFYTSTSC